MDHSLRTSECSLGQQVLLLVQFIQASFAGGLGLGLTPLWNLTKHQASLLSSLSNAVSFALVPSQPTFATAKAKLSPKSRNSWGAGPEIWLHLPLYGLDFQNALGSSCCLVLGQAQMGLLSSPERENDADITVITVIATTMVALFLCVCQATIGLCFFQLQAIWCSGYAHSRCGFG